MSRYNDKNWLKKKYVDEGFSISEVANICNVANSTIYNYLKKYEIPTRSLSEGTSKAVTNHIDLTPGLIELMEGNLLGDGCLTVTGGENNNPRYSHGDKHREYLVWLKEKFEEFGVEGTYDGDIYLLFEG